MPIDVRVVARKVLIVKGVGVTDYRVAKDMRASKLACGDIWQLSVDTIAFVPTDAATIIDNLGKLVRDLPQNTKATLTKVSIAAVALRVLGVNDICKMRKVVEESSLLAPQGFYTTAYAHNMVVVVFNKELDEIQALKQLEQQIFEQAFA